MIFAQKGLRLAFLFIVAKYYLNCRIYLEVAVSLNRLLCNSIGCKFD